MKLPFSKIVNNQVETDELAADFKNHVLPGRVIVVNGGLGSGKTYFISKVLHEFGIDYTTSPTFTIVNEYESIIKVFHFDFFRLKSIQELINIGWHEYLKDKEAVIFVEWGNLIPESLPNRRIEISVTILEETKRKFIFNNYE